MPYDLFAPSLGSIWGHGAYQAPDWTADWLHRELLAWLELAAQDQYNKAYDSLTPAEQNCLQFALKEAYRTNTYDKATDTLVLSGRDRTLLMKFEQADRL